VPAVRESTEFVHTILQGYLESVQPLRNVTRGNIVIIDEPREKLLRCPAGFINKGFFDCHVCAAGTYKSSEFDCTLCESDKYAPLGTDGSCIDCPDDAYTPRTGAANVSDCFCRGTFYGDPGAGIECLPCPVGGDCQGSIFVGVAAGYFRSDIDSLSFRPCWPEEACTHGPSANQTRCAFGYEGENCGSCIDKFYRSSGKCRQCQRVHGAVVTFGFLIVLVAVVAFFVMSSFRRSPEGLRRRSLVALVVAALQDLSLLPSYLPGTWPPGLSPLFSFAGFFNLNVDVLGIECSGFGIVQLYVFKMSVPIFFGLVLGVVVFPLHLLWMRRNRISVPVREVCDYYIAALLLFCTFGYTYIGSTILDMVDCVRMDDGTAFLLSAPSVECYNEDFWRRLPLVLIAIAVYIFGIPILLGVIIFRHRFNFSSPMVSRRYGMLVDVYRPGYAMFSIVTLVYKFLFVFVKVILPAASIYRPVIGLMLAVAHALTKFRTRPMADAFVRRWDMFHFSVAGALMYGIFLYERPLTDSETIMLASFVVMCTIPVFFGLVVLLGLYALPILRLVYRNLCPVPAQGPGGGNDDGDGNGKVAATATTGRAAGGGAAVPDAHDDADAARVSVFFTPVAKTIPREGDVSERARVDHDLFYVEVDQRLENETIEKQRGRTLRVAIGSRKLGKNADGPGASIDMAVIGDDQVGEAVDRKAGEAVDRKAGEAVDRKVGEADGGVVARTGGERPAAAAIAAAAGPSSSSSSSPSAARVASAQPPPPPPPLEEDGNSPEIAPVVSNVANHVQAPTGAESDSVMPTLVPIDEE
jgi:hypothetical protein